jgi:ABC-type multidrug transport system fused ATPase/permease subunit
MLKAAENCVSLFDGSDNCMAASQGSHFTRPGRFIWHYIRAQRGLFLVLAAAVILASTCAVVAQYQMKVLVDAMTAGRQSAAVWSAFFVFIALIAAESGLWRFSATLTCRGTIRVGVDMRLDLFDYLSGQSIVGPANYRNGREFRRANQHCRVANSAAVDRLRRRYHDF